MGSGAPRSIVVSSTLTKACRPSLARAMYPVECLLPVAVGLGTRADSMTKSFSRRVPMRLPVTKQLLVHRIKARKPPLRHINRESQPHRRTWTLGNQQSHFEQLCENLPPASLLVPTQVSSPSSVHLTRQQRLPE